MKRRIIYILISINILFILSGCDKIINIADECFNEEVIEIEGVSIDIFMESRDTVSYDISNRSDTPLYYEGHRFARLQKEEDGYWYDLEFGEFAETSDFQVAEIPKSPERLTLNVNFYYGAELEDGHYRLLAMCYPSIDDLYKGEESSRILLAKEFTIN